MHINTSHCKELVNTDHGEFSCKHTKRDETGLRLPMYLNTLSLSPAKRRLKSRSLTGRCIFLKQDGPGECISLVYSFWRPGVEGACAFCITAVVVIVDPRLSICQNSQSSALQRMNQSYSIQQVLKN